MVVNDVKIEVIERIGNDRKISYTVLLNDWVYLITQNFRKVKKFIK